MRIRMRFRVPTAMGRWSGRYSRTAGSITGAVEGSAKKANANGAGTDNRQRSTNPSMATQTASQKRREDPIDRAPERAGRRAEG